VQFTREINRLLLGILAIFGMIGLSASYWAVFGPDTILQREDNPRRVLAEASIIRGDMVDRDGALLATSVRGDNGDVTRHYLYPETNSALGYFSLRYGVGGAEAAYDAALRGDDLARGLAQILGDGMLHRPQQGSAIRLTLDLALQQHVADTMAGQTGAAVVLSVPDGQVLAMVSLPTFDPNTLDANWNTLIADSGKPFFNRALQGNYQPGGTLETPLMGAALLYGMPLDQPIAGAGRALAIDDATLTCAVRLPDIPLTLRESYAFACPSAFARLAADLGAPAVDATFQTFHLTEPLTLPGFVAAQPGRAGTPIPSPATNVPNTLVKSAVGQGNLTVTPLGMAVLAAAIVNDGNAPQPYALLETRAPGSDTWQPVEAIRPTIPIATANTARKLQDLMRDAVANGAAVNAGRPNIDIGGHATLAYSGDSSQAWFVGFATLGGRRGVAVAVVLENSDDPGLAADIGGSALAAAQGALNTP
jgi:penicillin-binding protein A